jgi:hypothetical protein
VLLDGDAAGVKLLIVDACLAVPLGELLSDRASKRKLDFRVLLLAGAEDDLPALQAGIARSFNVFEKPLRVEAFIRKVRACLAR